MTKSATPSRAPQPLVLASSSPRRQELLRRAGIDFEARAPSVSEARKPGESPQAFVLRLAREKALDVARKCASGRLVLGADTVVVVDEEALGKPASAEEAFHMLRRLSGRTHRVLTGICVVRAGEQVEELVSEETRVTLRSLEDAEIPDYVNSGEPLDKAGGYGIQGLARKFVTRIEGCYSNVVGLPVARVYGILKRLPESNLIP